MLFLIVLRMLFGRQAALVMRYAAFMMLALLVASLDGGIMSYRGYSGNRNRGVGNIMAGIVVVCHFLSFSCL